MIRHDPELTACFFMSDRPLPLLSAATKKKFAC